MPQGSTSCQDRGLQPGRKHARSPVTRRPGLPLKSGSMPQDTGPYLHYAVFCEKVLHETDGAVSLIRIIDRVTVTVTLPTAEGVEALPAPLIAVTFVVSLTSGEFTGPIPLKVRIETPSRSKWPEFETSAQLQGEDHSVLVILPVQFPAQDEGIYWFAVEVAGDTATRVPLRVVKQLIVQATPPELG
jgi:hypothetical protein